MGHVIPLRILSHLSEIGFLPFFSGPAAKIALKVMLIVWLSLEMVVEFRIRKVLVRV